MSHLSQVCISQKLKLNIKENLPKLDVTLFDEAQNYIINLLDSDAYKRFINNVNGY